MKEKHSPVYYRTRTAVRTIVWGGLALFAFLSLIEATSDDRPLCDVRIVSASPARWESDVEVDVAKCIAPQYMILHQDGSWDWVK